MRIGADPSAGAQVPAASAHTSAARIGNLGMTSPPEPDDPCHPLQHRCAVEVARSAAMSVVAARPRLPLEAVAVGAGADEARSAALRRDDPHLEGALRQVPDGDRPDVVPTPAEDALPVHE